MISDAQFEAWRLDPATTRSRIVLVELDHASGRLHIGSRPWLSPGHQPYHDALIRDPYLEESLYSFAGIGDFEIIDLKRTERWESLQWYGHPCSWLVGDANWPRSDYRLIARAMINEFRPLGNATFRVNLGSTGLAFEKPMVDVDTPLTLTVRQTLDWLTENAATTVSLFNVTQQDMDTALSFTISPSDTAASIYRTLAASIDAHLRVDKIGNAQIVRLVNTGALTINADMISEDGLSVVSTDPPYSQVIVERFDGTEHKELTRADIGQLSRTRTIKTFLANAADADALLQVALTDSMNRQNIYSMSVLSGADLLTVGDPVSIFHDDLVDTGHITRIRRTPLDSQSTIEVRI